MQCASHLNLGHVIQVINPGDPVPNPILPPTSQTGAAPSLRMSAIVGWLLALHAVLLTFL